MEHEALTRTIIGCAMVVHRELGPGFLVQSERPIQVRYDDVVVGEFICDLFVERLVIIENKAVQALSPAHAVQLVNYLTATGVEVGLLLNFGAQRLEWKRKFRTYRQAPGSGSEPG